MLFFSFLCITESLLSIDHSQFTNNKHIVGDPSAKNTEFMFISLPKMKILNSRFKNTKAVFDKMDKPVGNSLTSLSSLSIYGNINILNSTFNRLLKVSVLYGSGDYKGSYIGTSLEIGAGSHTVTDCLFSGSPGGSSFWAKTYDTVYVMTGCIFEKIRTDGSGTKGQAIFSCSDDFSITTTQFLSHYRNAAYCLAFFTRGDSEPNTNEIKFTNCVFSNITSLSPSGSGMVFDKPLKITFTGCQFSKTKTSEKGGALQLKPYGTTANYILTITHCTFDTIQSGSSGACLDLGSWYNTYIRYCIFTNILLNQNSCGGGIIACEDKTHIMYFEHNYCDPQNPRTIVSGALLIKCYSDSTFISNTITIKNNTFINTLGGSNKNSIYAKTKYFTLQQCTFLNHYNHGNDCELVIVESYLGTAVTLSNNAYINTNMNSIISYVSPSSKPSFTMSHTQMINSSISNILINLAGTFNAITVENSTFSDCKFADLFISHISGSTLYIRTSTFSKCVFSKNMVDVTGFCAATISYINMVNCDFSGSSTTSTKNFMNIAAKTLIIQHSNFQITNISSNAQRLIDVSTACNPILTNCTFNKCYGRALGMILYLNNGTTNKCSITNCVIIDCHNFNTGMFGFYNALLELTITKCKFLDCTASSAPSIVNQGTGSTITINNCIFSNLTALQSSGYGAIYFIGTSTHSITNTVFENCYCPSRGGALYISGSSSINDFQNCSYDWCSAGVSGGAIDFVGDLTLNDCHFSFCTSPIGGAISVTSSGKYLYLNKCTFTNNSATDSIGGAIRAKSITVVFQGETSKFINNSAKTYGGSLYIDAALMSGGEFIYANGMGCSAAAGGFLYLTSSSKLSITINGLTCHSYLASNGGFIYSTGYNITLINCTICDCKNAVYFTSSTSLKITDSVFSDISNYCIFFSGTILEINNCEIKRVNSAGSKCIAFSSGTTANIQNTIFDYVEESIMSATTITNYDFYNCSISNSYSRSSDGGVFSLGPTTGTSKISVKINQCNFNNISSSQNGGCIKIINSNNFEMSECHFSHSFSTLSGGCLYLLQCSINFDITSTTFEHCYSETTGGAIYISNCLTNPQLTSNIFNNCSSLSSGSCLYSEISTEVTEPFSLTNNTFSNTKNFVSLIYSQTNSLIFDSNYFDMISSNLQSSVISIDSFDSSELSISRCKFSDVITQYIIMLSNIKENSLTFEIDQITMIDSQLSGPIIDINSNNYQSVRIKNCVFHTSYFTNSMISISFSQLFEISNCTYEKISFQSYMFNIGAISSVNIDALYISNCSYSGSSENNLINCESGAITIQNCMFNDITNSSTNAKFLITFQSASNPQIFNCSFLDCSGSLFSINYERNNVEISKCNFTYSKEDKINSCQILFNLNHHTISIDECQFIKCNNINGAIICNSESSTFSLENCLFNTVTSVEYGALAFLGHSKYSMANIIFRDCSSNSKGSAIYLHHGDSSEMSNIQFYSCQSSNDGGAVYLYGPLSIINSQFYECSTTTKGGALFIDASSEISLVGSLFKECNADCGGAIYAQSATSFIFTDSNTQFESNTASKGGGIYLVSTSISGSSLISINGTHRGTTNGGFFYCSSPSDPNSILELDGMTFQDSSSDKGSFIYSVYYSIVISNCNFISCSDPFLIENAPDLTVSYTCISEITNYALSFSGSSLNINHCEIKNIQSNGNKCLHIRSGTTTNIENTIFEYIDESIINTESITNYDFYNCSISNSYSRSSDGGVFSLGPTTGTSKISVKINQCNFNNISSSQNGGCIKIINSNNFEMSECHFSHSFSTLSGGCLYLLQCSINFDITSTTFEHCYSETTGGAIYISNCLTNPQLTSNIFNNCSSLSSGSCLYSEISTEVTEPFSLTNNTFTEISSELTIFSLSSYNLNSIHFTDCTFQNIAVANDMLLCIDSQLNDMIIESSRFIDINLKHTFSLASLNNDIFNLVINSSFFYNISYGSIEIQALCNNINIDANEYHFLKETSILQAQYISDSLVIKSLFISESSGSLSCISVLQTDTIQLLNSTFANITYDSILKIEDDSNNFIIESSELKEIISHNSLIIGNINDYCTNGLNVLNNIFDASVPCIQLEIFNSAIISNSSFINNEVNCEISSVDGGTHSILISEDNIIQITVDSSVFADNHQSGHELLNGCVMFCSGIGKFNIIFENSSFINNSCKGNGGVLSCSTINSFSLNSENGNKNNFIDNYAHYGCCFYINAQNDIQFPLEDFSLNFEDHDAFYGGWLYFIGNEANKISFLDYSLNGNVINNNCHGSVAVLNQCSCDMNNINIGCPVM